MSQLVNFYFVMGSLILLTGLISAVTLKFWYSVLLKDKILLNSDKSFSDEIWNGNFARFYYKIYYFNWTNADESLREKEKPNFVEIGPFTMRVIQRRSNIVWNLNQTVTFNLNRSWEFVPEMSQGKLSDRITNVNTIAMFVGNRVKKSHEFLEKIGEQIYNTKTVEELLFEDSDNEAVKMKTKVKNLLGVDILKELPPTFERYFNKNFSKVDIFNMKDGKEDSNKLGKINSWNYKTQSDIYSDKCDQVRGTLGDLWPKNISYEKSISLFIPDLCGSIDFFQENTRVLDDIEGTRFIGNERTFDNGSEYSENLCYCPNNECHFPSGVRNITKCQDERSPLFISFPHFFLADEVYRQNVTGMNPIAEKHQSSITLQKQSGILMEMQTRLQMNARLGSYTPFEKFPELTLPRFWIEEYVQFSDEFKFEMNNIFCDTPRRIFYVEMYIIGLGGFILILGYFTLIITSTEWYKRRFSISEAVSSSEEHQSILN